jgi:hypothetical protein
MSTSPNVVFAFSLKVTSTVPPPPPPDADPVPLAFTWMAIALRAGTVAENEPPEIVKLCGMNNI